ncbi:MAG: MerR family transcriptional regulator [Actinomycetes bacterium]
MSAPAEAPHRSIGEVLSLLSGEFPDVTISKIRFLESQGLIAPERTPSGYRKFYDRDVERLRWILTQQKDNFLPLKVIKDRLDDHDRTGAPLDAGPIEPEPTPGTSAGTDDAAGDPPAKPARAKRRRAAPIAKGERLRGEQLALDAGADDLVGDASGASLTRDELATASGLTVEQLLELESFGLVAPAGRMGAEGLFDEDALAIARIVAGLLARGAEPRHLRMYRNFAEREAQFYEQLVFGVVRPREPGSPVVARDAVVELATLGRRLRTVYLRRALDAVLRAEARRTDAADG